MKDYLISKFIEKGRNFHSLVLGREAIYVCAYICNSLEKATKAASEMNESLT